MEQFKDAHYFHIPSQGNVYTTAELKLANDKLLMLAASLKREIFSLEYLEAPAGLVPSTKEIPFTYIPSGAEIISLDAFNKSLSTNEVVIGITIIKNSNDSDSLETFLNIYSQLEENDEFDIENVAQNCLTVELNFIPYKLMHTKFQEETVFLLSGSDNLVHVYRENPQDHVFKEIQDREVHFPEFEKTPSPVVWIDILHYNNERITAFSCECGYVKVTKVDTNTNKRLYSFVTRFANHVPKVQLYLDKNHVNLVVVNATLPPALFRNISKYGLSDYVTLHRLDDGTVFTTCLVADVDFDGNKEIIVGTSSGELFMYKYNETKWYLEEVKFMAAPVLSLNYGDLSGDGVKELVVSSMIGIHVLQHDPVFIQNKLKQLILQKSVIRRPVAEKEEEG
ncbi:unnamed protein product [Ceutorhynchus assimilis]|uniref:KICSTOR complex protein kaptin n=1 Tax=Ceutorhynchus assimilis TaxID=467358 RepID=A0A9N9QLM4_9CUCU|nr:unnamed protein product [Ceutorhynchus assimilis]